MSNLRRLAEAATPGSWAAKQQGLTDGFPNVIVNAEESGYPGSILWGIRAVADAAYIAAASPDVILALLARAEQAESAVERLRVALADVGKWPSTRRPNDSLIAVRQFARAALQAPAGETE